MQELTFYEEFVNVYDVDCTEETLPIEKFWKFVNIV